MSTTITDLIDMASDATAVDTSKLHVYFRSHSVSNLQLINTSSAIYDEFKLPIEHSQTKNANKHEIGRFTWNDFLSLDEITLQIDGWQAECMLFSKFEMCFFLHCNDEDWPWLDSSIIEYTQLRLSSKL